MDRTYRQAGKPADLTPLEQGRLRTEQTENRAEQAKSRVEAAETRTEQAEERIESAKSRTEQAETRTGQAETRAEHAETRAEQAETRAEHAETRAEQAETTLNQQARQNTNRSKEVPYTQYPADGTVGLRNPIDLLTARQREVLRLIAQGRNTKQIAGQLQLSPKTVEYHRLKLMAVLNVHDIPGLVRLALRVGFISPEG